MYKITRPINSCVISYSKTVLFAEVIAFVTLEPLELLEKLPALTPYSKLPVTPHCAFHAWAEPSDLESINFGAEFNPCPIVPDAPVAACLTMLKPPFGFAER